MMPVYFVEAPAMNALKIGYARIVSQRFGCIQSNCPCQVVLIMSVSIRDDPSKECELEQSLHEEFSNLRTHGEWFKNEGKISDFISQMLLQHGQTLEISGYRCLVSVWSKGY